MGRGSALSAVPLRLGPLAADGYAVRRSGLRWLREDGAACRAGEAVAYCNIGLTRMTAPRGPMPLASELLDFQAVLSTPVAGRLRHGAGSSRGGFLDLLDLFQLWSADFAFAAMEPDERDAGAAGGLEAQVMMVAGRRRSNLSEDRSGLLTGWHDRSRAWRVQGAAPAGTLLSLGICELDGVVRGERYAFLELFSAVGGSAQAVFVPDAPLVHSAPVILDQIDRTDAQRQAIADDLARTFADAGVRPEPRDWIHAGAMLQSVQASPATDSYEVLTREGLRTLPPADAILLSVNAEGSYLRHRRLGYAFQSHDFRLYMGGPGFTAWLKANFELVRRSVDQVRADYVTLVDRLRALRPDVRLLICNAVSSSGYEDVHTYAGYDPPLDEALASVRDKDRNLMLHDLARERDVAIVDIDAIAADLGGQRCVPDGVHQNGLMQAEVRAEILRILRARNLPGFAALS